MGHSCKCRGDYFDFEFRSCFGLTLFPHAEVFEYAVKDVFNVYRSNKFFQGIDSSSQVNCCDRRWQR